MNQRRSGAAFLLLVVLVLLVIVAAVRTMVQAEYAARRGETDRMRVQMLIAATEAVEPLVNDSFSSVALPIEPSANERIELTLNDEKSQIIARWRRGDDVVDEVSRSLPIKVETE
ncbi:hypothetical protein [Novipirellula artificiosorum]|uniref:Uncharacterized protein n=1 Tax=Novipirellula artificiosorum TaxID=2528016 RepID=A0A5C6D6X8_9BACT|nr:hypothetical protein [Novipirellula artificiosorum]TWU32570.1 hypothetical protein Poly41_55480 [Novipirellula artificiosorum]